MRILKAIIIGVVSIVFVYVIMVFYCASQLLKRDKLTEKERIECLQQLDINMHAEEIILIDFSEVVDCFIWDSILVDSRGAYKTHLELNYTVIDENFIQSEFAETSFDWLDGDRNMNYIYFFHRGEILNNAIAISRWIIDFSEMAKFKSEEHNRKIAKQQAIFTIKSKTCLDSGIVDPKGSDKYIWKTAFLNSEK